MVEQSLVFIKPDGVRRQLMAEVWGVLSGVDLYLKIGIVSVE